MLNLIKMDLYRLVRTLSFLVMIAVTVMISIVTVSLTNMDIEMIREENEKAPQTEQTAQAEADGEEEEMNIGITVQTEESWLEGDIELVDLVCAIMSGGVLMVLCAIFVSLFVNAEQRTGYIKNIAGQLPCRGLLSVSKLLGIAVLLLAMFAAFVGGTFVTAEICLGDTFKLGDVSELVKVLAVQYALHFAFSAFVAMLCTVSRSTALGMVIGIILCSGLMTMVYQALNKLIQKADSLADFDLTKYPIETKVIEVTASAGSDVYIGALITGAIYLVFSIIISMTVTQKRDIR